MKHFASFLLKATSEEGSKVVAEVIGQKVERQGKYGRVSTPTEVTAGLASEGLQLSPPVHQQLLASLCGT